jgi:hypothetical protein
MTTGASDFEAVWEGSAGAEFRMGGGVFLAMSPIPNLKIGEIHRNLANFTKIVKI